MSEAPVTEATSRPDLDASDRRNRPWIVILYNDDWHAFDEVIAQVQKATACSYWEAFAITYEAHTRGRAIAFRGSYAECERVANVLREIRLQVETDAV